MTRKFTILLMALLALAGFKSWGQETIEIGNGTGSSRYFPFSAYYKYSYNEMLYLADEIGTAGTITSISFYANGTSYLTYSLDIYMKNVNKTQFSSESDFIHAQSDDLVWSGNVSGNQSGWVTFELETPFAYDGTQTLMIAFDNNTGIYDDWFFKTHTSSLKAISACSDDSNQNPLDPTGYKIYEQTRPNIKIGITPAGGCQKPKDLAASDITATGATISWTDNGAESYDLAYGVASTFDLSNPSTYTLQNNLTTTSVTLSGLTAETEYKCAVKAHCSAEEESNWSDVISFMPTATKVLTVCDGNNTNTMIPIYGGYADSDYKSQFIFPAQYLESMQGGIIKSMTFYAQQANVNIPGTWSVYLSEVDGTTLSGLQDWNDLENVVEGQTMTISGNKLTVNFPTPFEYNGGNLLIGFNETESGSFTDTYWYGVNQSTNTAYYRYFYYSESTGPIQFLPKTTFAYEDGAEKFAITFTQPEDAAVGTISADYEQAAAGTTVTLSADFNLGYTLNYFMVDGVQIVDNTFEMPEHNVTVSVAYNTLDMYDITFDSEIDDDIISVSATYNDEPVTAAPAGTEITLSYSNLDEGYTFNYWTLNGAQLTGSTFEMPEEDAEIGVNLTVRERYAVTIDSDVQDYITANPSSDILDGTTVTLTISPATGYVLTELLVLDEGENEQAVTINPENSNIRTFIMPESNVTVSAVFSRVYNISIDMALVGGSISQMSAQGTLTAYPAGTQVFLFANPDEDYSFVENSFIVIRSDGEIGPTVTCTNMMYSFIMPESNVTVSATFNKTAFAVSQVITPTYSGSFYVSKTAHVGIGETVTLSNFNAYEGCYFDFEDVNSLVVKRNDNQETVEVNNYGNIYQFAMPTSDVTVTATFKDLPRYSVFVGDVVNGTITLDNPYQDIFAGAIVYFEVEPETGYTLESITVTPEEGNPFEPTHQYSYYYFTMPSSNVTISATFRQLQTYTINYYVNGQLDRTMQCQEDRFVNNDGPQNIAVPAGMTFEGWGVAEIDPYTTEMPAVLDNTEHPTQNYDLYAVLSYTESVPASSKSGETWKKVTSTSELSAGDEIVLVYSNLVMCTRENAGWEDYPVADVTISNGEITYLPENAAQFTLIANNGYWNLQYNELGATRILATNSSNNELASKDLYELWYPTYMSIDFTATTNGNSVLFYNSDTYMYIRYRSDWSQITTSNGSSTTYACHAYKKDNPMVTTNYYMTSVLTGGTVADATVKNIIVANPITVSGRLEMNENGLFRNDNAANFVFADGAQFYYTGEESVLATFKKDITGYTGDNDNYYLIANPTNETTVTNLTSNNYDLYTFNPTQVREWHNEKENNTLTSGIGYLYANSETVTLEFAGYLIPAGETEITLVKAEKVDGIDFPGFNLIGNPFACKAYVSGYNFYTMVGGELQTAVTSATVAPCEGFFVEANANGDEVTISTTASEAPASLLNLTVNQNRGNVIDRAIVRFDGANDLHKFMLNPDHTNIRLAKNGEEFAAVSTSSTSGEIPVSFKAERNGSYTINVDTENVNAHYIHLIDNKTGMDVDLLATPSYTFNASTSDYAYRFKLVFNVEIGDANGNDGDNNSFAYMSNGNLIIEGIEGEATMQIVDVLGRVVSTEIINGSYNKALNLKAGLYILNLNGMTQKIVVE